MGVVKKSSISQAWNDPCHNINGFMMPTESTEKKPSQMDRYETFYTVPVCNKLFPLGMLPHVLFEVQYMHAVYVYQKYSDNTRDNLIIWRRR